MNIKISKNQIYQELMQAIIDRQKEILGAKVSVDIAQKVSELDLFSDGKIIKISGEPEKALQTLVTNYFKLTTEAGLEECVSTIKKHLGKHEIPLPEEITILLKEQTSL